MADAEDFGSRLAGSHLDLHVGNAMRTAVERVAEELVQFARGVFGELGGAGDFIGFLEQRIVHREQRHARTEVRRNRAGVAQGPARTVGEVDGAEHGKSKSHDASSCLIASTRASLRLVRHAARSEFCTRCGRAA